MDYSKQTSAAFGGCASTKALSPKIERRVIAESVRGARQTAATIEDRIDSLLIRLRGARPTEATMAGLGESVTSDVMENNVRRLADSLERSRSLLDEIETLI